MLDTEKAAQILTWIIQTKPDLVPAGSWVRPAEKSEDVSQATDAVIVLPDGGEIPVAYREWHNTTFRALHLRYENQGQPTEFGKIKGGEAKWYLYAWHDGKNNIVMLKMVDLDRLREKGWFQPDQFARRWPGWLQRRDSFTSMVGTMFTWMDGEGCVFYSHGFDEPIFKKSYTPGDPAPAFGPPQQQDEGNAN